MDSPMVISDGFMAHPCATPAQVVGAARVGAVKLRQQVTYTHGNGSQSGGMEQRNISGDGTVDQAVGSLDVNALEGWT